MFKGKTKSGFEFEIDPNKLNDMRVVDAIVEMQSENEALVMTALTKLMNLVLGEKQKQRLYTHLQVEGGRVPIDKFNEELTEIITSMNEGKN